MVPDVHPIFDWSLPQTDRALKKKVYIVDDHPVVRSGLIQILEQQADFEVCGDAATTSEAILEIDRLEPDIVLCDLTLEGRGGLELTKQISSEHPDLPVLIVSMHDEKLYAKRALAAGARGYVMKRRGDDELIGAVRELLAGRIFLSDDVRKQIKMSESSISDLVESPTELLTDRELEIFMLIGQGYAPRHIAEKLSLSVSTIEVYRERLKEKLGLESSPVLLRYAIRHFRDEDVV